MRAQHARHHKYKVNALDLLSPAGTCTLCNLFLSCPVDDVWHLSYTTLEEALLALPASNLHTHSVTIYYTDEDIGGSCSSVGIVTERPRLRGTLAVWAMPGMLSVSLADLLPNLI
jgi:hypothetical protein